jgi:hypothetical protein
MRARSPSAKQRYDLLSPSSLPPETVFGVRHGLAWMIVGRDRAVEWEREPGALARAHAIAKDRGDWRVAVVPNSETVGSTCPEETPDDRHSPARALE